LHSHYFELVVPQMSLALPEAQWAELQLAFAAELELLA
jgi:hypothetical protein